MSVWVTFSCSDSYKLNLAGILRSHHTEGCGCARPWSVTSGRVRLTAILSTLDMGLQGNIAYSDLNLYKCFNPTYAGHGSAGAQYISEPLVTAKVSILSTLDMGLQAFGSFHKNNMEDVSILSTLDMGLQASVRSCESRLTVVSILSTLDMGLQAQLFVVVIGAVLVSILSTLDMGLQEI